MEKKFIIKQKEIQSEVMNTEKIKKPKVNHKVHKQRKQEAAKEAM